MTRKFKILPPPQACGGGKKIRSQLLRKNVAKKEMLLLTGCRTGKQLVQVDRLKAKLRRLSNEVRNTMLTNMIENSSSFGEDTTLLHDSSFMNVSQDTRDFYLFFFYE